MRIRHNKKLIQLILAKAKPSHQRQREESHATLWYRIRRIESSDPMELIQKTAEEIMKQLEAKEFRFLIADGTGFGYRDTHKLPWLRGKEIREVLVGVVKGKTVVVGVNVWKAYSDDCKLLSPMLRELKFRAKYFLADAY